MALGILQPLLFENAFEITRKTYYIVKRSLEVPSEEVLNFVIKNYRTKGIVGLLCRMVTIPENVV